MVLSDDSILGFLLILLIIQKSASYYFLPPIILVLTSGLGFLLATIRDNGLFPCHRCLVSKFALHRLGCPDDIAVRIEHARQYLAQLVTKARKYIYKDAKPINGTAVNDTLKSFSGVPTVVRFMPLFMSPFLIPLQNAFVARLGRNFNPSKMLVVDLMHEFELGVWKSLFTLLIRLLYAAGKDSSESLVAELDSRSLQEFVILLIIHTIPHRYRQISTFGCGTIRKFAQKFVGNEKTCSSRLRRPTTGMRLFRLQESLFPVMFAHIDYSVQFLLSRASLMNHTTAVS